MSQQICGGFKAAEPADADVQALVELVKADVEARLGSPCPLFQALKYTTQVVAGVNYIVKTKTNEDGTCVHIKIHKPLPHTGQGPSVMDIASGHSDTSDVVFF